MEKCSECAAVMYSERALMDRDETLCLGCAEGRIECLRARIAKLEAELKVREVPKRPPRGTGPARRGLW